MSRRMKIMICVGLILLICGVWIYWGNHSIGVTHITVSDESIPKQFDGFVIVQVSDLHNEEFGEGQRDLLEKISAEVPDMIVITGDLIDLHRTDIAVAMEFVTGATEIAPVYYVPGNHEAWSKEYPALREQLEQSGVTVLEDEAVIIEQGGASIQLIGLADPEFVIHSDFYGATEAWINARLQELVADDSYYSILLSHRPELIEVYAQNNINLVFSGHAHGGQFRIPFIGGVVAPDQGLFPKYTSGKYTVGQTQMVVSRGLGNSVIPVRINNRPEIVVVELESLDL